MRQLAGLSCWPHGETCGAIAIGVFDGVHIGHQTVLRKVLELSMGRKSCVLTFWPHPARVTSGNGPQFLTSASQKSDILAAMGLDMLIVQPFTTEFAAMSPSQFVSALSLIRPSYVVVGEGFRFGSGGSGNVDVLTQKGNEEGFGVVAVPRVSIDDVVVSSTAIRRMVQAGDLLRAARFLGRAYRVRGPVGAGDGRGRHLGFPTANIIVPEGQVIPPRGVYSGRAIINKSAWPAVINIGIRPTFGGRHTSIEVHIIGFDSNIYGKTLDVEFCSFLREERKFMGGFDLSRQVSMDKAHALEVLRELGFVYNEGPL